jgi:hypothetical protein
VLLPQESDPVEDLLRPLPCGIQALPEVGILLLELIDSFRAHARPACCYLHCLHTRLGLKGAPPETCQLVAEVADELLKLGKCRSFRTFAV